MNSQNQANQPPGSHQSDAGPLVLPLTTLDRTQLSLVGGKAANLGELIRAGFPVPGGFCVTTIAYALVSATLEPILAELAKLRNDDVEDIAHQAELAAAVAHSALGPQRRPAALDCCEHGLDPNDIEVCFLLTGKACGRKVFSGGR